MRALVLLLVLANLAFFALAQGWLQPVVGLARHNEREPQRLGAQLNPDAVRIVTATDRTQAAAAPAPAASAADCPPLIAGAGAGADGCALAR
jgi:hypothetical protein